MKHAIVPLILFLLLVFSMIIFFPLNASVPDSGRLFVFGLTAVFSLLSWSWSVIKMKTIKLANTPIVFGAFGMVIAGLLSLLISSPNKLDGLTNPFGIGVWTLWIIIFLFGGSLLSIKDKAVLQKILIYASGFIALLSCYQATGMTKILFPTNTAIADPLFSLFGSPITHVTCFMILLPILISSFIQEWKHKHEIHVAFHIISIIFVIISICITLVKFLPVFSLHVMPFLSGWKTLASIAADGKTLFFGVGIEQFLPAFTKTRDISMNMTPLWNTAFSLSNSFLFHIGTTMGITGIITLLLFLFLTYQSLQKTTEGKIQGILIILTVLFLPPTFLLFPLVLILVLLSNRTQISSQEIADSHAILFSLAPIILGFLILWGVVTWYRAEIVFSASVDEAARGNGTRAFELQQQASSMNPTASRYHLMLSQTSLSLAQAIVDANKNENGEASPLSEDDQKIVSDLISNAIRQGKLTITLAPNDVMSWTTLAQIYQALVGSTTDADTWAIASYHKAVSLDPTNPLLHTNFGGLYRSLKRWDDAQNEFQKAIALKSDYLNAYYNLAYIYKEKGDKQNAIHTLEQALLAAQNDTTNYSRLLEELQTMKNGK